jgi:hypothetical protein
MNPCQNCGQPNAPESNFCRFCGTHLVKYANSPLIQPQPSEQRFEQTPPRPYSWKTDEFPSRKPEAQKTALMNAGEFPIRPSAFEGASLYVSPNANMVSVRCPHCGHFNYPRVVRKISAAGWIVFAVLLVTFFPLFWVGFLIKEDVRVCPVCTTRLS